MIARMEGKLIRLDGGTALVQVGKVGYEVMLPGYCVSALSGRIGEEISLCTMEYLEGSPGGGSFVPRMVGFMDSAERDFFRTFTSVKGMGIKKGLRALTMPISRIAAAIEQGDEKLLQSLPAVGKRMAQQMVAELRGKVEKFAFGEGTPAAVEPVFKPYQAEALEILIAWGEKRSEMIELIALAGKRHPDVQSPEELVPLIYKLKQGVEV
jgi:Holliday junction DNA helicase RuvA